MYHKLLIRCSNRKIKLSTLLNVGRQNLEKMLAFFLFSSRVENIYVRALLSCCPSSFRLNFIYITF